MGWVWAGSTAALIAAALAFARAVRWQAERQSLRRQVMRHFGKPPEQLQVARRVFAAADLPNVERAVASLLQSSGGRERVLGYAGNHGPLAARLADLLAAGPFGAVVTTATLHELAVGPAEYLACLTDGVRLLKLPAGPALLHASSSPYDSGLSVEVMAASLQQARDIIESVQTQVQTASIYRGRVISFECPSPLRQNGAATGLRFHQLTPVRRDQIILPNDLLERIERNTVGFLKQVGRLREAGRQVRRGLLFHGPPGTGKTYTATWLAQSYPGLTVVLLSGTQLAAVREACQLARLLEPSLVVLEDVDLIAMERTRQSNPSVQATLNELLNEMDGLTGDAAVIFVLTTNRPEILEPALAARPGRVDFAIEFPLPDADCRRRLLQLRSVGLAVAPADLEQLVARTAGASPAFLQELLRQAALLAALDQPEQYGLQVTAAHLDRALREIVLSGGSLTQALLGFAQATHDPLTATTTNSG